MGRKKKCEQSFLFNSNDSSNSSVHSTSSLSGIQRKAANDRERTRMRVLSKAFVKLKTSLPWVPTDTKLSKLDTLKLAASYIAYLTRILENDNLDQNEVQDKFSSELFQQPYQNEYHYSNILTSDNNNNYNNISNNFCQIYHNSSSKMLSCIALSSLEAQRTINQHLLLSNQNFYHTNIST